MTNTMQLTKSINVILKAISQDKDFRNDFNAIASTISDKIYSYFINPNCTCRTAIVDWINKNVSITNNLVDKYSTLMSTIEANELKEAKAAKPAPAVNKPPTAPTTPNPAAPISDPTAMLEHPSMWAGTVHVIERNPDKYRELIKKSISEKWLYRGINVVPDVIDGKPVWSIFFF